MFPRRNCPQEELLARMVQFSQDHLIYQEADRCVGGNKNMKALIDLFAVLTNSKTTRIAAASMLMAIIFYAVVLVIFGFSYGSGGLSFPSDLNLVTRIALVAGFALVFVMLWFFLYVQNIREAEDVYSRMREKLAGGWNILYQATNGPDGHGIFDQPLIVPCSIVINPGNLKLEISIDVAGNPVWEDGTQTITNVSLRHDIGNRYNMIYYYKGERKLRDRVDKHLTPDQNYTPTKGIEIEIVAILEFEEKMNENHVTFLKGQWYDLNGRVTQIFALIDELEKEAAQGKESPRRRIFEVPIGAENFSARMGDVSFKRLGA
jgi:hypothetical protein